MSLISKKICIIGESEVGKNSLITRFVERQFSEKYLETVGVKISQKTILFQGLNPSDKLNIQLLIWNVTGHHKFKQVSPKYLRGSSGAIAVADITRPQTIERLQDYIQLFLSINPKGFIIVALNKCDLIEREKLEQLIQLNLPQVSGIYPTSAKTGLYVDEIFFQIAYKILESYGKCSPSHQASLKPEIEEFSNSSTEEDNEPKLPLGLDLATPATLLHPNLLPLPTYTKGVAPLHPHLTALAPATQRQTANPWQIFYLRTMSCKRYTPSPPDLIEFPLAGESS